MKDLKLKICGLRQTENIRQLLDLQPDYIGFIFYEKSKRYVEELPPNPLRRRGDFDNFQLSSFLRKDCEAIETIPSFGGGRGVVKTGVFVNESIEKITAFAEKYNLDALQLHGEETPDFCKELKSLNLEIIKVFSVGNDFDFDKTKPYEGIADKFLFDTKGKLPGGNGFVFNWDILKNYKGSTPFFLSGGIGIDSVEAIQKFKHPMLFGLDVNSKFEIEPGLKDVDLVANFVKRIGNPLAREGKPTQV